MGVTGANGFPCCGKESVDIVETQSGLSQHQLVPEEDEVELKKELLELEPPHKVDLDLEPELELEMESKPKDPEQRESRTESLQPPTQQDVSRWSVRSNSSYLSSVGEDQASTNQRSIRVQTSKHLFWADKHIQASEHSLERVINMQHGKNAGKTAGCQDQQSGPKATTCSKKQLQDPRAQPAPPTTSSQQPPNPHPSSSSLSPGIGLADLVNFASSLAAVASSSKMDLPNLEHIVKAPPQKVEAPSTDPDIQLSMDQQEKKKLIKDLLEKPLKAEESQKARKQEDKNFFHPYLGFSKPGIKRATIEGEVKLLQQQTWSPPPKGAVKGSVPRTRKGSPLLLKIHFKQGPGMGKGRCPGAQRRGRRKPKDCPSRGHSLELEVAQNVGASM
ncbi:spermatogenesis-associated protein 32 isoform X1 [Zalophus californianus]|uniref:Spermatogenesis-associated protein 32 isoform X1 n=1 Tax=Zalophus californianus TaxID=9704 RepID=A0A6J2FLE8_ZALCA|nr:spermatogenesis-associated protein 32 isoform X1 [Zalophus californianus]